MKSDYSPDLNERRRNSCQSEEVIPRGHVNAINSKFRRQSQPANLGRILNDNKKMPPQRGADKSSQMVIAKSRAQTFVHILIGIVTLTALILFYSIYKLLNKT